MPRARSTWIGTAAALALLAGGCNSGQGTGSGVGAGPARGLPSSVVTTSIPLGDLAGGVESHVADVIRNPYAGNPAAVKEGETLFGNMNCAGCHGYNAKGGMGPDLTDDYWRYGGTPAQIYASIYEGRPKGMPAWGAALPPQEIWKLVSYIQSLGGTQQRLAVDQPVGTVEDDGPASRSMKGMSGADEH